MFRRSWCRISLATLFIAGVGCGSTQETAKEQGGASGNPSSGGEDAQGAGGANTTSNGGGPSLVIPSIGGSTGARNPNCSSNLRSVVDERGAIVEECPADQGCANGECVTACAAAAESHGSIGCEFFALDTPAIYNGQAVQTRIEEGFCYAVFLANAWDRPAKLSVSRGGQELDVSAFARIPRGSGERVQYETLPETGLPANEVAVLFLSHKLPLAPGAQGGPYCPVTPAVEEDAVIWGTGRGSAFRIVSDTPLSAYDIAPYGAAGSAFPSATLLLPAPTWGTNYVLVAPGSVRGPDQPKRVLSGRLWTAVVAMEDETTVRVSPSIPFPGASAGVAPLVGTVSEYRLDAGEVIQWQAPFDDLALKSMDPSGSIFESDKPFGLWTGNTGLAVASATSPTATSIDAEHEQIPPVRALGSEYVGAGIVTRSPSGEPESVPYRLLGVVDGTQLTWDQSPSPSLPTQLNQGQVVDFESTEPFSVRSQDAEHPFLLSQFMPVTPPSSGDCASLGPWCSLGDTEWVVLISTQQFLQHYVFFTDPSYATTNLVVTRMRGPSGFQDVTLECFGTLTGWQPVGNAGTFEITHVDLVRAGVPVKDCGASRHGARSDGAFGIVVWGTDLVTSYGYPAGGNFGATNDVVVPVIR